MFSVPFDAASRARRFTAVKEKSLSDIQTGDIVIRDLGGVKMTLRVTNVTSTQIHCGAWLFSRRNGAEIDPDLGWDEAQTGSFIRPALGRSAAETPLGGDV
jgi:hypothetical protein